MIPLQLESNSANRRAKCLTRLVLPIRYRFSADSPKPVEEGSASTNSPLDQDSWEYRKVEPETLGSIWRRSAYFTVDTSYALFRRAHWLKLTRIKKESDQALEAAAKPKDADKKIGDEECWTSFCYTHPPDVRDQEHSALSRIITVDIAAPTIVLFEAENARKAFEQSATPEDTLFQIGFLYLDCYLSAGSEKGKTEICLEDLLEFNERARCIWSPHRKYFEEYLRVMGQCEHLGSRCKLRLKGNSIGLWAAALGYPLKTAGEKHLWLNDKDMRKDTSEWVANCAVAHTSEKETTCGVGAIPESEKHTEYHTGWLATTDYRAFVWTYAYTDGDLASRYRSPIDRPESYGHWIKFMNVDSVSDYWGKPDEIERNARSISAFESDWAKSRTYYRWAHFGTYYGVSPHSGSLLTSYPLPAPPFDLHFKTLYFDQVLMLLYLRVMAFQLSLRMAKLSAEVSDALAKATNVRERRKVVSGKRDSFRSVRQFFMAFASLYQFPLLSTQQQGVELYTLFRDNMDIDVLFKDVSAEIDAWDRVMAQHSEEDVSTRVSVITEYGLPVAVATFLITALGTTLKFAIGGESLEEVLYPRFLSGSLGGWGPAAFDICLWFIIFLVLKIFVSML